METKISRDKLILAAGQSIKERNYWLNKLAGELVKSHFPYDYRTKQRDQKKNIIGSVKSVKYKFPGPLYAKVMKISGGIAVKLHMILVSGMFILLNKYTGHNDIMIGSPIYKQDYEGEFINTVLVFRKEIEVHRNFKELLLGVRNTIIEADENQNYPLAILPEELNMAVRGDEFSLFDTVLLLENLHDKSYLQGIGYNVLFSFSQSAETINGIVEYNSLLFRGDTVERIIDHYLHILDQVLTDINLSLYEIELLSDQEKKQLLCDFNNEEADYPKEICLQRLFEEQTERTPDSIVIIGKSLELNVFTQLTYGDLNTRADQLTRSLREKGVEPDMIVALMVEPSIEMMIGILGILKSGGAYLPIDPDYPQERIDHILKDSGVKILLTANEINFLSTKCVSNSHQSPVIDHHVNQLAYIIYTSGTSGKPKGVMVEHRNVVAYVHAFLQQFNINSTDAVIQLASYCFDVFVEEVFPVLLKGGRLVVPGRAEIVDIECLSRLIAEYHVTMIDCTPLLLNEFDKLHADTGGITLKSVRIFISGGDVLKPGYVEHLLKTGSVYNTYGPTESTVCATYYHYIGDIGSGDLTSIPIGKPISNYKIYILDEQQRPVPIGVAGELYISGPGVARGYLNRPELTADRFKRNVISQWSFVNGKFQTDNNPLNLTNDQFPMTNDYFYCTGDLARWISDGPPAGGATKGIIEYLGRIDFQVKIRGYRIELGEIEAQLERYESVEKAVVIDRQEENEDGEKYLCAYIVSRESLDFSTLRNYLSQSLPDYMIPAFFIQVDQIPVTPNGKVNRKALPAVTITADKTYVAPANKLEETLVEMWAEILNLKKEAISVNHNFFEWGGHSLKATVLASRIHKELDIKLPVLEIFKNQTIRQLSQYIGKTTSEENRFVGIEPTEKKEYYILSSVQRRLYFLFQLERDSTIYNIPDIIPLEKKVAKEQLQEIFNSLIRRHESLRTSFEMINEEPVQRIHDEVEFKIEYYDLAPEENGQTRTYFTQDDTSFIDSFIRPFDLSRAPLLRVGLVKTGGENYLLLADIHHIIMDAVSLNLLEGEFRKLFAGEQESLPRLNLQYRDYAEWQRRERERGALKAQEKFWLEILAGELPVLRLPIDFPRPLVQSFEGNTVDFQLEEKEVQQLKEMASGSSSTLYIVLLSLFNLLLFKLSGQEDIVVGAPVAGRNHADLQQIIGMFVNTLVVRNFPCAEKHFNEFLEEVKQRTLAVYENQDYPFEELVDKVEINRDIARNPVFDVLFVLKNPTQKEKTLDRNIYGYDSRVAKFDMTLFAAEIGEKFSFSLEYCSRLFKKETIERFITYFKNIVSSILLKPSQRLSEVEILTEGEKQRLLLEFNDTTSLYPGLRTICELFEIQVEKSPDHIALVGTCLRGSLVLTYRKLNEKSNHLAWILQEKGVCPDTIVGIMVERSLEIIIGILGILKAGGAYLPIDPSYPEERIEYMLKDSGAKLLAVANDQEGETMRRWEGEKVLLKSICHHSNYFFFQHSASGIPSVQYLNHSNHFAYIIYTSGTTGRPRGAGVYHRGLFNLIHWFVTQFGLNTKDRNLLLTSLSFDLTQKNIFAPLATGGTLSLPAQDYFDPPGILDNVEQKQLTWLNCTPAMIYKIIEYGSEEDLKKLVSLRYVFLGGEPILMKGLKKWTALSYFKARIVNTYGPTECADISTSYSIEEPVKFYEKNVPMGKPIYNVNLYILDRWFQLLPVGVPGELFIGGEGVGAGYLNRPELTYEKFILEKSLPVGNRRKFYKTGDLTCWLADGNIDFLGRIDLQVKIRGFRIEMGEIEAQLLKNDSLKEVVVLDRTEENGEKYLCAYIVMAKGLQLDLVDIKQYLSRHLPDYMIPSYFIPVEKIPLTANGKVDRKALPETGIKRSNEYEAPANEIEDKLIVIWSEVLAIEKDKIGRNDNFFQLGGHSLKVTILTAKIHKFFDVKIPLTQIFLLPTVQALGQYIKESVAEKYMAVEPVEKKEYYGLSSAQQRLYILQQMDAGRTSYHVSYAYVLEGELDIMRLDQVFRTLIRRHESLRTSFLMLNEEPVQRIHTGVEFKIEILEDKDREPGPSVVGDFIRPFDLSCAPLMRVGVISETETRHILAVDTHHIVTDGTSMQLLIKEFMLLYMGKELSPLRVQYKDYAGWQNRREQKEAIRQQEAFWLEQFSGEIPVLQLFTDFPRPAMQSFEGHSLDFEIAAPGLNEIKELAAREGTTLYMILLAAITIFLAKLSNQEDIVVGTPIAARRHADLENIIGMFVNTLAFRNFPVGEKRFMDFLGEVKKRTLTVFENQDYQFENLVEQVLVNRDPSRNPLFDVVFALQNMEGEAEGIPDVEIPGLAISPYNREGQSAKFDITLFCFEGRESLYFMFEYCTRLFKKESIERFMNYFKNIVSSILLKPSQQLSEVEILSEAEKRQILVEFNLKGEQYPNNKTIQELFAIQSERTPDHIAVFSYRRTCVENNMNISYRQLNEQSSRLAHYLVRQGVGENDLVGLMMNRSLEMIIGILGILNAGCGYVPLNPKAPAAGSGYILDECNARILISTRNLYQESEMVKIREGEVLFLEDLPTAITFYAPCTPCPMPHALPSNLAYVIFTSGSMGKPKGVPISHANLSPLLHWGYSHLGLGTKDRFIQNLSYYFDWSVWEIAMALTVGAGLYMAPDELLMNPGKCITFMNRNDITVLHVTPTQYRYYLNAQEKPLTLKYLFIGAEKLNRELVQRSFESVNNDCRVFNMYGPTECTIISAVLEMDRTKVDKFETLSSVPIGGPVANTDLFILDKYMNLCPVNVSGELYISGNCVAPGYLNNPELTAEKFTPLITQMTQMALMKNKNSALRAEFQHSTFDIPRIQHSTLYRTGDLCRRLPGRDIEFLGRIDRQVKIRGFRIELEEIENRLLKHPDVKEAKVMDKGDNNGEKYLCAYIVANRSIPVSELKEYLADRLPEYMIPKYFVLLDRIPLTPNGKVNLKALPEPMIAPGENYTAPGNEIEEQITAIWSEVLGIEKSRISINADFFDLGGHSLKVMVMIAKIHKTLHLKLELAQVFRYPTVRGIASLIEALRWISDQEPGCDIHGKHESEETFL